jgi:protein-S-isoprenylcysteine O-methyltransferase Ste14
MTFLNEPFFWALVSMFGLVGACTVVGTKKVGGSALAGALIVTVFDLGRFILVLPACPQSHFDMGGWHNLVGGVIFVLGGYFGLTPCLYIRPVTVAKKEMPFVTTGLYGMVRNPIYLGEILWCLGWAIIHRSVVGVALVPLWWAGLLFLIAIEEESLERALGQTFVTYKKQVRGRIIPGLPI